MPKYINVAGVYTTTV